MPHHFAAFDEMMEKGRKIREENERKGIKPEHTEYYMRNHMEPEVWDPLIPCVCCPGLRPCSGPISLSLSLPLPLPRRLSGHILCPPTLSPLHLTFCICCSIGGNDVHTHA